MNSMYFRVDVISFALVVCVLGISYGLVARAAGMSTGLTVMSSVLIFGGVGQFAMLSAIVAGSTASIAVLGGVLGNAKFFPLSLVAARSIGLPDGIRRLVGLHLICEPSVAFALQERHGTRLPIFWFSGLSAYSAWVIGTLVGAVGATFVPDIYALGLDAALPSLLLGLLKSLVTDSRLFAVALGGAFIALMVLPVSPPGIPVLAGIFSAVLLLPRVWKSK